MTLSYIIQAFAKLCHVPASRHQETPRQTDNYNAQMFAAIPFAMATPQVSRILNISRELETSREIPATYREALESRYCLRIFQAPATHTKGKEASLPAEKGPKNLSGCPENRRHGHQVLHRTTRRGSTVIRSKCSVRILCRHFRLSADDPL